MTHSLATRPSRPHLPSPSFLLPHSSILFIAKICHHLFIVIFVHPFNCQNMSSSRISFMANISSFLSCIGLPAFEGLGKPSLILSFVKMLFKSTWSKAHVELTSDIWCNYYHPTWSTSATETAWLSCVVGSPGIFFNVPNVFMSPLKKILQKKYDHTVCMLTWNNHLIELLCLSPGMLNLQLVFCQMSLCYPSDLFYLKYDHS